MNFRDKIPWCNPEISKRLPPVHGESFYKAKKNSPWNSFRVPQKAETTCSSNLTQKAKISSPTVGLIKLPAEDQAPEDQWSHPAYSGPCISLAFASVVPINGLLRSIRIDVSATSMC